MFWRVYYSNDTTIASNEVTAFDIERRTDVQVIVQESPDHNWITTCKSDYYTWGDRGDGLKWWGVDQFGLHHYLLQQGKKCVLFGVTIGHARFREIFDRAREEFGNKEIFEPDERRPE